MLLDEQALRKAVSDETFDRFTKAISLVRARANIKESIVLVTHPHIRLLSTTSENAIREFKTYLAGLSQPANSWAIGSHGEEYYGFVGEYSPLSEYGSTNWFIELRLGDLFNSLLAYYAVQLWRMVDLCESIDLAFRSWNIISAAACTRALIETAAVVADEVREVSSEWHVFKKAGFPTDKSLPFFVSNILSILETQKLKTRLGEVEGRPIGVKAPNILGRLNRFAKQRPNDKILLMYEWLSDAIHCSGGGLSVFLSAYEVEPGRIQVTETYARKTPLDDVPEQKRYPPTVAIAVCDVTCIAVESLVKDFVAMQDLTNDLGLTSGASFVSMVNGVPRYSKPAVNEPCPCGSGKKFKRCGHTWGTPN